MSSNTFCSICNKDINEKPWMTLNHKFNNQEFTYCCSYICSKKISNIVGEKYFHKVVNKEDFDMLFPIIKPINKPTYVEFTNTDYQEIMDEIKEEERIQQLEEDFNSSDGYSSEEIYE